MSLAAASARRVALREQHVARVNRVLDYIEQHLTEDLGLTALAEVAGFSPYHFHRIFTSVAGETPGDFISRIRVERAAAELLSHPDASITQIALGCGFSGPAVFARIFRAAFGMSATDWRGGGHLRWMALKEGRTTAPEPVVTQPSQALALGKVAGTAELGTAEWSTTAPGTAERSTAALGAVGADAVAAGTAGSSGRRLAGCEGDNRFELVSEELDPATRQPVWRMRFLDQEPIKVALEHLRPTHIAYVRYVGRYQGDGALFARLFGKLNRWAGPRGLLADDRGWFTCVYHDPTMTADDRLRVTVGLTVPPDTRTGGPVASMVVDGGRYAVGRFALRADQYADAWAAMMLGWLPESGCRLDDRHCFERFPRAASRPESSGLTVVDICLPVTPS